MFSTDRSAAYYTEFRRYWQLITPDTQARLMDQIQNSLMYRVRNKNATADEVQAQAELGAVLAQGDAARSSMDLAVGALARRNRDLYGSTGLLGPNQQQQRNQQQRSAR